MTFYFCGVPVAYGTVKTLTNESVRGCSGDLSAFKPSIIVGVPAIYELIRKGMVKKIHESPALVQQVFNLAYVMKKNVPLVGGILDKAVFAKVSSSVYMVLLWLTAVAQVKQATGGNLRLAMNGGTCRTFDGLRFANLPCYRRCSLSSDTGVLDDDARYYVARLRRDRNMWHVRHFDA